MARWPETAAWSVSGTFGYQRHKTTVKRHTMSLYRKGAEELESRTTPGSSEYTDFDGMEQAFATRTCAITAIALAQKAATDQKFTGWLKTIAVT